MTTPGAQRQTKMLYLPSSICHYTYISALSFEARHNGVRFEIIDPFNAGKRGQKLGTQPHPVETVEFQILSCTLLLKDMRYVPYSYTATPRVMLKWRRKDVLFQEALIFNERGITSFKLITCCCGPRLKDVSCHCRCGDAWGSGSALRI